MRFSRAASFEGKIRLVPVCGFGGLSEPAFREYFLVAVLVWGCEGDFFDVGASCLIGREAG